MNKFDAFKRAFKDAMETVSSAENMRKFGEQAAEMVRLRTRLGSGVEKEGANKRPLKRLSDSYKQVRRGKIAFFTRGGKVIPYTPDRPPSLHSHTTPSKSNLTFTGQMLDSLDVTSARRGEVTVGPTGSRKGGLTNKEVAGYVSKERPFNNLSKVEQKRMSEIIADILRKLIGKELTK